MSILYVVIPLLILFLVLVLMPSEENKIRKVFKRRVSELSEAGSQSAIRIQGQLHSIDSFETPIFGVEATYCETKFYEMSEYSKRNTSFNSDKGDWRLEGSELKKNDFLIEVKGKYALVNVEFCHFLITKHVESANNFGDLTELIFEGRHKYSDFEDKALIFLESIGIRSRKYRNPGKEIVKFEESRLSSGDHVSIFGDYEKVPSDNYPQLTAKLRKGTQFLYVFKGTEEHPIYITDDFGILFG